MALDPVRANWPTLLAAVFTAEHGHCPPVANMQQNIRMTMTNRVVRFTAWNSPYHVAHHAMPMVPFHQLPALRDDVAEHLKTVAPGYAAFTCDYACSLSEELRTAECSTAHCCTHASGAGA